MKERTTIFEILHVDGLHSVKIGYKKKMNKLFTILIPERFSEVKANELIKYVLDKCYDYEAFLDCVEECNWKVREFNPSSKHLII